jgi:hypothetical protein
VFNQYPRTNSFFSLRYGPTLAQGSKMANDFGRQYYDRVKKASGAKFRGQGFPKR